MKLELFSRSESNDIVRYFVEFLSDSKLLINHGYDELIIVDLLLNKINSIKVEHPLLLTHYYFSDDRKHFLWNSEERYLYYLNLDDKIFKVTKLLIPKTVFLDPYYIWDENRFIISGIEKMAINDILFFNYDINQNSLNQIDNNYVQEKYSFFQRVFDCSLNCFLLCYDIKRKVLIYSTKMEGKDEIHWYDSSNDIQINFTIPLESVHLASCFNNILVLVHEGHLLFYQLDREIFRLDIDREYWAFDSAVLFESENTIRCVVLKSEIRNAKKNIIEVYNIEL